jgi:hypothetical protein
MAAKGQLQASKAGLGIDSSALEADSDLVCAIERR